MSTNKDRPSLGHNQPPEPSAIERTHELIRAANAGIAATPIIRDAETAGRFQGFVQQLRDARSNLEAERKHEAAPHDEALARIKAKYKDELALIELARIKVQPLLDAWLVEAGRRADEAFERRVLAADKAQADADELRRIANQSAASVEDQLRAVRAQEAADERRRLAGHAPERAAIRGEYAPRAMSLKGFWSARITNEETALNYYRNHPEVRAATIAAILKVARASARRFKDETQAAPGIQFIRTEKAI